MNLNWPHVTEVFGGALERNPVDRVTFLSDACSRNDALGAEVTDLLVAYDQMGDFLTNPAVIMAEPKKDDGSQNVGRKMGPYEIEAALGEGGRGTAFLATDGRQHKQVVLKKLGRALARDETAREALMREANTLNAIKQAHIGPIVGIEEIYGEHYIVSDYISGSNLRGLVESGPTDPRAVIAIGTQVADALQAGHQRGINHSNLKPENIVFREGGAVVVLDYGLAHTPFIKSKEALPAGNDAVTTTIGYLSPEQLEGPSADPRSDLFSLGVVLYELVTGRNPFAAPAPAGTITRIKTLVPPAPSTVQSQIPPALDLLIMKCLEKDPKDRPPHATAVFEALKALEAREPLPAEDRDTGGKASTARPGRPTRRPVAGGPRSPWITHQLLIIATELAMAYLVWQAESSRFGLFPTVITFTAAGTAAVSAMMRLQWLIQAGSDDFPVSLKRMLPVVVSIDLILTAALLLAAVDLSGQHFFLGLIVAVLAVCIGIAALFVEPSKAKTAFPTGSS